jgi:hypothetical protein
LQRLLEDFVELHTFPTNYVAGASIKLAGGVSLFDFANNTLSFVISYRPDHGGNPALAFRYKGYSILPKKTIYAVSPVYEETADAGRALREAGARSFKAKDSSFLGFFDVMWLIEDATFFRMQAVEVSDSLWPLVARGPPPETCYFVLETIFESGAVWRLVDGVQKAGEMRLVKNLWQWFENTDIPQAAICRCHRYSIIQSLIRYQSPSIWEPRF